MARRDCREFGPPAVVGQAPACQRPPAGAFLRRLPPANGLSSVDLVPGFLCVYLCALCASALNGKPCWFRLCHLRERSLIPHPDILAAFHHPSGSTAMLVQVAQAVRFQIVDEHREAALYGDPRIRSAAPRMHARIGDAQRRPAVHVHVGRPGLRRADALVRATRPAMIVLGYQRAIAEPRLFSHSTVSNISRRDRGQLPWR